MKLLKILLIVTLCIGCSTENAILKKSRSEVKAYLDTPYIERSLHLPDYTNTLRFGYEKQSVKNNKYEDGDVNFPLGFSFVRNITDNFQSLMGYIPLSFAYRIHEDEKLKSSVFFGAGWGYSSLVGTYFLPYGTFVNRYIFAKKHAVEGTLGTRRTRKFDSIKRKYENEYTAMANLTYLYQIKPALHGRLALSIYEAEYSTNCPGCTDKIVDNVWYYSDYKDHQSIVYPVSLSLEYRLFVETTAKIYSRLHKFGYEAGYERKVFGLDFTWYFPTDG